MEVNPVGIALVVLVVVAVVWAYRHGKLAGALAQIKEAEAKVKADFDAVKASPGPSSVNQPGVPAVPDVPPAIKQVQEQIAELRKKMGL